MNSKNIENTDITIDNIYELPIYVIGRTPECEGEPITIYEHKILKYSYNVLFNMKHNVKIQVKVIKCDDIYYIILA